MLQTTGRAQKVSIYVSEGSTHGGVDRATALLDFLFRQKVAGATVLKGIAGFGAHHHLHSSSILAVSDHLPVKVEFIETPEKVQELLPQLMEMSGTGMIEVQETLVVKIAGALPSTSSSTPPSKG
jgi:hypothetical protein